jgi:capsular polysaccharide biosynthesis protein
MCPTDSLPLLVSERLSGLARWSVERHVRSCPACRAELSALQHLSESLKAALPATPSPTLDEKILSIRPQSLRDEPTRRVKERSTTMKLGSIPIGACLGLSAAVLITLFQPVTYRAQGKLIILNKKTTVSTDLSTAKTLVEIMNSSEIRTRLQKEIDNTPISLNSQVLEDTPICEITAESDNPDLAATAVNHWMKITINNNNQYFKRSGIGFTSDFSNNIGILNEATVPTKPISPKPAQNLVIGLVVGTLLGGLFGFLQRH